MCPNLISLSPSLSLYLPLLSLWQLYILYRSESQSYMYSISSSLSQMSIIGLLMWVLPITDVKIYCWLEVTCIYNTISYVLCYFIFLCIWAMFCESGILLIGFPKYILMCSYNKPNLIMKWQILFNMHITTHNVRLILLK